MSDTVIVGARESKLAVTQTKWVVHELEKHALRAKFSLHYITTEGDRKLDISLTEFQQSGMFINELEEKLQAKEIDVAVHSLKDIPLQTDDAYPIVAIPMREDFRDAYIGKENVPLDQLRDGAIIGTSSPRRKAQLQATYPHLKTKWIRGPIDSRIKQMKEGAYDGIILAVAGLNRLGLTDVITTYLDPVSFTPAPGQGALAVQCRAEDEHIVRSLRSIHHEDTYKAVYAERHVILQLDEEDKAPIGAYATVSDGVISLYASVYSMDGKSVLTSEAQHHDPFEVAKLVADDLVKQGAHSIIGAAKEELQNE